MVKHVKKIVLLISLLGIMEIFSGCATVKPSPAQLQLMSWQQRSTQLKAIQHFTLKGSLGITQANKVDILSFDWQQNYRNYEINLHGPLSLGGAKIVGDQNGIAYWKNSAEKVFAKSPESLFYQQFGWTLPVSNLKYWILAIPASTKIHDQQFDKFNHLICLVEQDWRIRYSDFISVNGVDLPTRIQLESPQIKIKIVIKTWQVST